MLVLSMATLTDDADYAAVEPSGDLPSPRSEARKRNWYFVYSPQMVTFKTEFCLALDPPSRIAYADEFRVVLLELAHFLCPTASTCGLVFFGST
ncbi:unnamed protein product [Protopolystoma xenopodis]|uniref:Uncharacterized protein n=1 Tax=Protopolystoma xenopodis TaxID=117903 RepID=A0A3S5FFM0_9PLAT|nr:unnamed protein product [Protopolystoma xenopodis]